MTTPRPLDDDAKFQLGLISGKLDLLLVQSEAQGRQIGERIGKLEARVDLVEEGQSNYQRDRSWLLGGAAAIGAGISGVATWLGLR